MKINIEKTYMLILVISMLISMYVFSFFDGLPIIYIIYMLFSFYFLIKLIKKTQKINLKPLILVFILLLISLITFAIFTSISTISLNTIINSGKLLIWGLILSLSISYLKKDNVLKMLNFITIISTIYLFIQAFFSYVLSINLSNVFNFGIITFKTVDMGTLTRGYRPSAFFAEPIDYSNYILCYLTILLLDSPKVKYKNIIILFLILGMLLSASTTGLFMLILLLAIYALKNFKKNKKMMLTIILLCPIVLLLYLNLNTILGYLGTFGETVLINIEKIQYASSSSRIGGSYSYLKEITGLNLFIGYGIGNEYIIFGGEASYMNTITRMIFQYGIIGLLFTAIYFVNLVFKTKNHAAKFIIVLTIIECFTSNILFSISNIFMLSIAYMMENDRKVKK